jgi:hypothetical protein
MHSSGGDHRSVVGAIPDRRDSDRQGCIAQALGGFLPQLAVGREATADHYRTYT